MVGTPSSDQLAAAMAERNGAGVSFPRIAQRTTPETVTEVLRKAILDGSLPAGGKLREAHIAAEFGVSRTTLRESLTALAEQGLVVKIPYKGAFVAQASRRDINEIAHLRARMEPYAIELALPQIRGGGRELATGPLHDMARAAETGDIAGSVEAHMAFHRSFYELSGNNRLLEIWSAWEPQLQLFLSADHQHFANLHDVVADHERLLGIIETGDLGRIAQEVDRHVSYAIVPLADADG
jgi:DNA-binding GntR family transcriptional regulator